MNWCTKLLGSGKGICEVSDGFGATLANGVVDDTDGAHIVGFDCSG